MLQNSYITYVPSYAQSLLSYPCNLPEPQIFVEIWQFMELLWWVNEIEDFGLGKRGMDEGYAKSGGL